MVYQYRYIMPLVYVFAHTPILRLKRRGIQPQGIEEPVPLSVTYQEHIDALRQWAEKRARAAS
jgi:hypothetical protein